MILDADELGLRAWFRDIGRPIPACLWCGQRPGKAVIRCQQGGTILVCAPTCAKELATRLLRDLDRLRLSDDATLEVLLRMQWEAA